MPALDYDKASRLLEKLFAEAEQAFRLKNPPALTPELLSASRDLFASGTKSYREVLVGCCLVRLLDRSANIRHPYVNQSDDAFNGRTLDERVVNPFLQEHMVPCSRGPYLASFRRNVKFVPDTAKGLRDKVGYAALLVFIDALVRAGQVEARSIAIFVLYGLCELRDASDIALARISRLSLEQFHKLAEALLRVHSGGVVPVLLTVAMLRAIKTCYSLKWEIAFQGINVSDKASGVGGDITVTQGGQTIMAIEVTERPIERSRVVSTFNTKVVRGGIEDYLFVYASTVPGEDARAAARAYFAQGHEINFVDVRDWITNNLATIGSKCRENFIKELLALLASRDVPGTVKIAWNGIVRGLINT